jgi:hypothetical protein
MKRSAFIVLLFCLIYFFSEGQSAGQLWKQKRYEAVAGLGPTFLFCDVGGFSKSETILGIKDLTFSQTRFNLGFSFKYRLTEEFNARLSLSYGYLHASDARGSNEDRDYESAVSVFEPALIGEYYIIKNKTEGSYLFSKGRGRGLSKFLSSLDFYVFTGIGGLNYTIKPNDKLEAHGVDPGGFTAIIPVGIGSTLVYSPDFSFGVELGGRYSFTDNLEGYTSQFSSSNDVYYFLNFTITYKMKTGSNGLPSFK